MKLIETVMVSPCKYCKRTQKIDSYPNLVSPFTGLFYAQCPTCNHYGQYDFVGTNKKNALRHWNIIMDSNVQYKDNDELTV